MGKRYNETTATKNILRLARAGGKVNVALVNSLIKGMQLSASEEKWLRVHCLAESLSGERERATIEWKKQRGIK